MVYLGDEKQAAKSGSANELGSVLHEANRRIAFPDLTFDQPRTVVCRAVVVAGVICRSGCRNSKCLLAR